MNYVFLDDSPEGDRMHAAIEAWRVATFGNLLEDILDDENMRDYVLEVLPDMIDALASDKDLMLLLYKHLKEPMDDILLDILFTHNRHRKRHVRELTTIIDPTGFAESGCTSRRYYAATRLVYSDPIHALEIIRTIPATYAGRATCIANIIKSVMHSPADYIKVIAQLQADGAYDVLEAHIHRLNNAMYESTECRQIMLKWALKTDDLRLFREIRGSKYISPAHARAEGGQTIAKALET
jgi:hypothetical protein